MKVPRDASDFFHLDNRVEVGMMAEIFLGWIGQKAFYAILCVCAIMPYRPMVLALCNTRHNRSIFLAT